MSFVLSEAREILARTPGVMRALLAGLSDAWIHANTEPNGWSPFDVVGHLIHGEETDWIPRLRIILESGGARAFEPFDRFAQLKLHTDGFGGFGLQHQFHNRRFDMHLISGVEPRAKLHGNIRVVADSQTVETV